MEHNLTDNTFPKRLAHHANTRPQAPAYREKNLGIWQTTTWTQAQDIVQNLACGLTALGFQADMNLAIIGDNRPRLYLSFLAAQTLRAVPVPLYQDAPAADLQFVLHDAQVAFAIAENQEQVDKLLELREQLPQLTHIIYDDPRGMRHYSQTGVQSLDAVLQIGRDYAAQHPQFYAQCVANTQASDLCVMLYTSGTTGKPKGVCHTHTAMLAAGAGGVAFDKLSAQDNVLSYLPMAWVGDNLFSISQALVAGFTVNCPESSDTVTTDMREIGPTYYFAPPRVFESMLTTVMIRMEDAGAIKRKMFHYFMDVAKRCGSEVLDGRAISVKNRVLYTLGNALVYAPLRNVLGMSRIRVAYTAGAAIGPDLFKFYRSIGVNLKQLYGSTETCAYVCLQPDGQIKFDSVGTPAPGVEVKIDATGEVLVKSLATMREYYKRPDATAEVMDAQGYFHTGDAGVFDNEGHLKIIDRAKDVGRLNNGAMFAPNYIENKLKFFQHVKEAVTFGHERDYVCAFINIDLEAVGNWAERRGLAYAGYVDLASKPEVLNLIEACIVKANADLANEGEMSASQIKRFLVLHKELDPDDDELTRTRKVRRNFVAEKYAVLIEALYSGKAEQFIETQVKFEDGRTGSVSATLPIREAQIFAPVQKAA